MKRTSLSWIAVVLLTANAEAQDSTPSDDSTVMTAPPTGSPSVAPRPSYEELRRAELKTGLKRTRTALIATSASFAVGLSLVIPAFTSDNCVQSDFNNDFTCNTAGRALLGVGTPFLSVGFWGMLVSGIMLGVRKGKVRRLDERIAYQSRAKLWWDPHQSKFVF